MFVRVCVVGHFMLQPITTFALTSYYKRFGHWQPLLVGSNIWFGQSTGNEHITICTSFVQKYAINTKAGIVYVLVTGTLVKLYTLQTELK